jgi:hypothetical protein
MRYEEAILEKLAIALGFERRVTTPPVQALPYASTSSKSEVQLVSRALNLSSDPFVFARLRNHQRTLPTRRTEALQDVDYAGEGRSIGNPRPATVGIEWPRRQQRFTDCPQLVWH